MEPTDALNILEKSDIFVDWRKKNKKSYLSNFFTMIEKEDINEWHIGYYNEATDKMVTFIVGKEISITPESEVFKEKGKVLSLDMTKLKINLKDALEKAIKFQNEKYPGNSPLKKIILLQNFEKQHIYNITFVTMTFKTLNIKVSSIDGSIISDKIHSIFDFNDNSINKL